MKTILVPTDFSGCANNALSYAKGLATKLNSKIILHHSCHLPAFTMQVPFEKFSEEELLAEARNSIKDYIDNGKLKGSAIDAEFNVSLGLAVDNIVALAEEKKADLIIMGTKGTSGIEEVLLGSNAATVMEKAPCMVLTVPEDSKYGTIRKIAFATDYHENDILAISIVAVIASKFNAELVIVHDSPISMTDALERDVFKKFEKELSEKIAYENISFKFLTGFNVATDLNAFLEDDKVDILAMCSKKRSFFSKLFNPSLTKKMIYHTHVPVLAFHTK
jgi:nucleotide-binding universal stress UspA family protein